MSKLLQLFTFTLFEIFSSFLINLTSNMFFTQIEKIGNINVFLLKDVYFATEFLGFNQSIYIDNTDVNYDFLIKHYSVWIKYKIATISDYLLFLGIAFFGNIYHILIYVLIYEKIYFYIVCMFSDYYAMKNSNVQEVMNFYESLRKKPTRDLFSKIVSNYPSNHFRAFYIKNYVEMGYKPFFSFLILSHVDYFMKTNELEH